MEGVDVHFGAAGYSRIMDFDGFAPGHSAADYSDSAVLRVLVGGRLVLNAAAHGLLGGGAFVQLLWDADTDSIGILPSAEGDPDSHRLAITASQAIITSPEFVDLYGIPLSHGMPMEWDGRMLIAAVR
ncbi:MAG: hypothetical protein JWN80_2171 [Microbacteriaceae bacterium]|nr:hypothetical protein [Microbacteriaceae bacterium]